MRRSIAVVATAACSLALAGTTSAVGAGAAPAPAPPAGAAGAAVAGGAVAPVEESPDDRYVVVMRKDPLVRSTGSGRLAHLRPRRSRASALRAEQDATLRSAGLARSSKEQEYTTALNGFAVETDLAGAQRLARDPAVALVVPDALRQVHRRRLGRRGRQPARPRRTSTSLSRNGLNDYLGLTGRDEAYGAGITGKGVVVGVIDTGVWPEHPSLAPRPGLPARPDLDEDERSACAFGNTGWNEADAAVHLQHQAHRRPRVPRHLPGGDGPRATPSSTPPATTTATGRTPRRRPPATPTSAPRSSAPTAASSPASLPTPRSSPTRRSARRGGYASDLVAAIDQSVADGVDVINFSLGGPPNTVSPEAIALLFAADAGIDVAASVGNAGPGPGSIGGPADLPWVTGVGATTYPTSYGATLDLDRGPSLEGASITPGTPAAPVVDGGAAGSAPCVPGDLDPEVVQGAIVVCAEGAVSTVVKSFAVEEAGGVGLVVTSRPGATLTTPNTHVPSLVLDRDDGATPARLAGQAGRRQRTHRQRRRDPLPRADPHRGGCSPAAARARRPATSSSPTSPLPACRSSPVPRPPPPARASAPPASSSRRCPGRPWPARSSPACRPSSHRPTPTGPRRPSARPW